VGKHGRSASGIASRRTFGGEPEQHSAIRAAPDNIVNARDRQVEKAIGTNRQLGLNAAVQRNLRNDSDLLGQCVSDGAHPYD
jgi:hypothetical protein